MNLRELIFPRGCALCGGLLVSGEETGRSLCDACAALFPADASPRCRVCGKPLISEKGICMACRKGTDFAFDAAVAVYPYSGRFERLLAAYKFEGFVALSGFFAEKLLEARDFFPGGSENAVWVPVPPRPGKIRRSGWDQVEELGRALTRKDGKLPVRRVLKRLPSKSQKELDKEERRHNLDGKIVVREPFESGRDIVLFDDVFTTGATLSVCARALKDSGAARVLALSLFYD